MLPMTLQVQTEAIGKKLSRLIIINDSEYIGKYERSQDADITRQMVEVVTQWSTSSESVANTASLS